MKKEEVQKFEEVIKANRSQQWGSSYRPVAAVSPNDACGKNPFIEVLHVEQVPCSSAKLLAKLEAYLSTNMSAYSMVDPHEAAEVVLAIVRAHDKGKGR